MTESLEGHLAVSPSEEEAGDCSFAFIYKDPGNGKYIVMTTSSWGWKLYDARWWSDDRYSPILEVPDVDTVKDENEHVFDTLQEAYAFYVKWWKAR